MLISGTKETIYAVNNSQYLEALKKFIEKHKYWPRSLVSPDVASKDNMTKEEILEEQRLGGWVRDIAQNEKGNTGWLTSWQYPWQQVKFNELLKNTPNYEQKKNTDRLGEFKKFVKEKGYTPRRTKLKKLSKEDRENTEILKEMKLGHWIDYVYQNTTGNSGHKTEWQNPEQQIEFDRLLKETPNYDQKKNTDKFEALKKFIKDNGYLPRCKISPEVAENTMMTEEEILQEVKLGQWVSKVSLKVERKIADTISWQYPEQQTEFNKLYEETASYDQKKSMDRLIEFMKFCRDNGYKPRQDTKSGNDLISPVEKELGSWIYRKHKWQYPWQQTVFDELYSKTDTWSKYMEKELAYPGEKQIRFYDKYNLQDLLKYMKDHNIPLI